MTSTSAPRVLLTGPPGCGKTTVIRRTVALLARPAVGFYTEEVRRGGARVGFDVVTLDGARGALARVGGSGPRVGKYGVDVPSFERIGVRALEAGLEDPRHVLVVDELGKMEFHSRRFVALLPAIFAGDHPVLGTILWRPHPVADGIRHRAGVDVVEVTARNRGALTRELVARFTA